MNNRTIRIIEWTLAIVLIVILGALFGWYLFLHTSTKSQASVAEARGFNTGTPSFTGTGGSTDANIAVSLSGAATSSTSTPSREQTVGRLWQISKNPVAGAQFTASSTVEYVDEPTGYVFSASPLTGVVNRLTNTLRPKVYEAALDGNKVIERSLDGSSVVTFLGQVASSSTSTVGVLQGGVHLGAVLTIAPDQKHDKLIYLAPGDGGSALLMSANWSGANGKRIATLPIAGWQLSVLPDGTIALTEKASDGVMGYSYEVESDGALTPIVSGPGLSVTVSEGGSILYSTATGGNLTLFSKANESAPPKRLPFATLAEKCAWDPIATSVVYCAVPKQIPEGSSLPDSWYQGKTHFADEIWRYDTESGSVAKVYDPAADDREFDIQTLQIDPSDKYLLFENRTDGSLWLLRLQ